MKRKLFALLLCVLCLVPCLTACAGQIEDTNGTETALCAITDADILKKMPKYNAVGMVRSQLVEKQSIRVNQLSGVYAFNAYTADEETLTVTLTTTLYEGNLRAVLLHEGEYLQDIALGEEQAIRIENATGKYQVRLAAESAKLDAALSFSTT